MVKQKKYFTVYSSKDSHNELSGFYLKLQDTVCNHAALYPPVIFVSTVLPALMSLPEQRYMMLECLVAVMYRLLLKHSLIYLK